MTGRSARCNRINAVTGCPARCSRIRAVPGRFARCYRIRAVTGRSARCYRISAVTGWSAMCSRISAVTGWALFQVAVTGLGRQVQLISQSSSTYTCHSWSALGIHCACYWDVQHPADRPTVSKLLSVPVPPGELSQTVQSCCWDVQQTTSRPTVSPTFCQSLFHQGRVGGGGGGGWVRLFSQGTVVHAGHQDLSLDSV